MYFEEPQSMGQNFDPDHHGTPANRSFSMTEGLMHALETRRTDVFPAAQEGADHIFIRDGRPQVRLDRSMRR